MGICTTTPCSIYVFVFCECQNEHTVLLQGAGLVWGGRNPGYFSILAVHLSETHHLGCTLLAQSWLEIRGSPGQSCCCLKHSVVLGSEGINVLKWRGNQSPHTASPENRTLPGHHRSLLKIRQQHSQSWGAPLFMLHETGHWLTASIT